MPYKTRLLFFFWVVLTASLMGHVFMYTTQLFEDQPCNCAVNDSPGNLHNQHHENFNSHNSVHGHLANLVPVKNVKLFDPSSIRFLIDINVDTPTKQDMVVLVMWISSAIPNEDKRSVARRLWAKKDIFRKYNILVRPVFVIGQTNSTIVQSRVNRESLKHGDIVQINMLDTYKNLIYKTVSGIRWTSIKFGEDSLFFKCDDDSLILPDRLSRWLLSEQAQASRTMYGYAEYKGSALRSGKYAISAEEWSSDIFANTTLQGMGYFITGDLLKDILSAVSKRPLIWIEDAFITGIIREDLLKEKKVANVVDLRQTHIKKCKDIRRKSTRTLRLAMRNKNIFLLGHWYED